MQGGASADKGGGTSAALAQDEPMQVNVPTLFHSKKFGAAALASILSFLGVRYDMTIEQIGLITAPLYAYIGGQSLADFGKERAKVEATGKGADALTATEPQPQKP